ncbi:MAG: hypothetical protein JW838_10465 [Spirochaetes bacterium]|nr:hypothetical protein [Spirochaetota bacterium]
MTIRPIDLQSNISQITEVGRSEQARSEALVEQQHLLQKESGDKGRMVNTKLDEAKKGDNAVIHDEQKKEERRREESHEKDEGKGKRDSRRGLSVDERMGTIIDILK